MIDIQNFKTATPTMENGNKVTRAGYNQMTPLFGKVARRNSMWLWVKDSELGDEKGVVLVVTDMDGVPVDENQLKRYGSLTFAEGGEGARNAFIKQHYGNLSEMGRKLGISPASASRYNRVDPKRFLLYVHDIAEQTGVSTDVLVNLFK